MSRGRKVRVAASRRWQNFVTDRNGRDEKSKDTCRTDSKIQSSLVDLPKKDDGIAFTSATRAEILLPPFVKLCDSEELPPNADGATKLRLTLGSMVFPAVTPGKAELIETLDRCRDDAARTLDDFKSRTNLAAGVKENDYSACLEWKRAFQALVAKERCDTFSP